MASVYVGPSTIRGAGDGLFAAIPFKPGDMICEYTGKVLTFMQALKAEDKTYMMGGFGMNAHLDAKDCPESLGRYINDCRNECDTNAKFIKLKRERKALVVALKQISRFRRGRKYSHHTANRIGGSAPRHLIQPVKNKHLAKKFGRTMSHAESILRILRKNPVEKHEALLNNGDIISQESTVDGINFGDVKVVRRIGLGTHAEVYEVLPCRSDVCHVRMALKIEKPIKHASGFIDQEILVLASVASGKCVPNIVGVYTKDICGTVCRGFCMELYHDSLSSLKAQRTLLDISVIRDSFLEFLTGHMFSAVVQFHKYGYLHRDIKPSNFMFKISSNHSLNFSLVDFGSSVAIGERNPSEFRGTGAYAPVESDPWLSRIEDDYWSVIFSVVDLCIPGGLPWRSLSARNDDGRAELVLQKRDFFHSINDSVSTDITSKIPSRVKDLIKEVITNEEKMKNVIEEFVSDTNFPPSSISDFIDLFLTPPLVRLNLPKSIGPRATPASVLLNGSCRTHIINDCELPSSTASVLFPIPCNSDQTLMKAQAILHQAAANKHIGRTPDVSALGERICLTELSGGGCDRKCPLRHLACTGIARSAIIRSTSRIRKICFDDLFDKCNENCGKLHLDPDTVRRMYIDNQVPAGQPSKRSKHS